MRSGWTKPMNQEAIEANRRNGRAGGRPRLPEWAKKGEITKKALAKCPQAIEVIYHEMMHGENPMNRLQAAKIMLEYGVGRPPHSQPEEFQHGNNQIVVITGVPRRSREDEGRSLEIEGEVVDGHEAEISRN